MKAVFECRNELLMNYIFSKGSCFEHEKEFRVVLKLSSNIATNKEDFCIKNGILVPYIDIDIEAKEFKKMIKSITISPLLEKEIAKKGLEKFLVKNGYEIYSEKSGMGIKIETSNLESIINSPEQYSSLCYNLTYSFINESDEVYLLLHSYLKSFKSILLPL